MAHDVFISHSTQDKAVSDAVCVALENAGIRCWIAPRDVQPGRSFAGEITRAIQGVKAMVLIFSAHSNNSEQVLREVQLAVDSHLHIVQFRIEDVLLNDDLKYFLSTPHWLDALTPPLKSHIERLKIAIIALLGTSSKQSVTPAASPEIRTEAAVAERFGTASSWSEKRVESTNAPQKQEASMSAKALRPLVHRGRKFVFAGAMVALLTAGIFGGWWFGFVQQQRPKREWLPHDTEVILSVNTEQFERDELPKRWRKDQSTEWQDVVSGLNGGARLTPVLDLSHDVVCITRAMTTTDAGTRREFVLVESRGDVSRVIRSVEKDQSFERRLIGSLPVWVRPDFALARVDPRILAVGSVTEVEELVRVRLGIDLHLESNSQLFERFQAMDQGSSLRVISRDPPKLAQIFHPIFTRELLDAPELLGMSLTLQNPEGADFFETEIAATGK